jgi:dipeptide/tripeptide permease
MISSTIYIIITLVVLVVIATLAFFIYQKRGEKKPSPMVGLGLAFIVMGIIFGQSRLIGYGLIGVGVALAVVDMIVRLKKA